MAHGAVHHVAPTPAHEVARVGLATVATFHVEEAVHRLAFDGVVARNAAEPGEILAGVEADGRLVFDFDVQIDDLAFGMLVDVVC